MLVCRFVLKPSRQSIRAFSLSRVRPLIRAAAEYAAFPPAAMATMVELERQGWCLAAGIAYPQPWMNLEEIGAAVAISVDTAVPGAVAKAEAAVSELAAGLFASREDFMPVEGSVVPYAEAVARAFSWHCTADGVAVLRTKGVDALVVIGDGVDSTNTGPLSDPLQTTQTWSTGSSCRACGGGRGAWGHDLDSVRAAEVRLAAGWCNDGVGLCRHGGNSRGRGRGRGPSTRAWGAAGESEREREREREERRHLRQAWACRVASLTAQRLSLTLCLQDASHKHAASTPLPVSCVVEKLFAANFTITTGHVILCCNACRSFLLRFLNCLGNRSAPGSSATSAEAPHCGLSRAASCWRRHCHHASAITPHHAFISPGTVDRLLIWRLAADMAALPSRCWGHKWAFAAHRNC